MQVSDFEDDLIGLQSFAHRLESFIKVEKNFVEGALVFSVTSRFGAGKTTFLKMWQNDLEQRESDDNAPVPVYLSAWESDYFGDPLFSIVSALMEQIGDEGSGIDEVSTAIHRVGQASLSIANQAIRNVTGVDVQEAWPEGAPKGGRKTSTQDAFEMYQQRKEAMGKLKNSLSEFVSGLNRDVIFFIDELDRCRPDYSVSYLETIKHIFDVHGAVFILSADRSHLENSAKAAFGPNLDFEEYYRKFIHRDISLPEPDEDAYRKITKAYIDHYLQREPIRYCKLALDDGPVSSIVELLIGLRMTPRQTQEVFRVLGHVVASSTSSSSRLRWGWEAGVIMMSALKVAEPRTFYKLGSDGIDIISARDLVFKIDDKYGEWWFSVIYAGGGIKANEGASFTEALKEAGILEEGGGDRASVEIRKYLEGWGNGLRIGTNKFVDIRKKIDHVMQWE